MNRRAALMSLPATAVISQVKVEPGDTVVIECDVHLSDRAADNIRARVGDVWPGRKVIVLSGGLKMRIAKGV